MKQKPQTCRNLKWLGLFIITSALFFTSCKKEDNLEKDALFIEKEFQKPGKKPNPFSYINIKKAKVKLGITNRSYTATHMRENLNDDSKLYEYIKFDPNAVTGDVLKQLESDTTVQILDFPFANGEMYNDELALDEVKAKEMSDGMLYAVVKKNSTADTLLRNTSSLNPVLLDELFLPNEEDTTLQFQAFREAGYTEEMIARIRICLLKRPSGFVRYLDEETGNRRPVANMQVWGLVFGIPLHTYTDGNGHYRFPWRFNAGTIMGTKAKNSRVNIKPFNTQGAWILTLGYQFIVGSTHIRGWVSSCDMNNDVDFNFDSHKQNRYWAQLMDAVNLHDGYTATDNILNAPDNLTIYAHWGDNYGDASAPMLGHISGTLGSLVNQYLTGLLNGSGPNDVPNLFNLLTGLLPDITVRVGNMQRIPYSSRLMQTAFHELGHASHFRRAGQLYWRNIIFATVFDGPGNCGGYGCGTRDVDGYLAVGESWAEYIGTEHALRNHPVGQKGSAFFGGLVRFDRAIEEEIFFSNAWIPTGVYNDLIDVVNNDPNENFWDRTGGLNIRQLYQAFGPDVHNICDYESEILRLYPFLNVNDVNDIFFQHGFGCF